RGCFHFVYDQPAGVAVRTINDQGMFAHGVCGVAGGEGVLGVNRSTPVTKYLVSPRQKKRTNILLNFRFTRSPVRATCSSSFSTSSLLPSTEKSRTSAIGLVFFSAPNDSMLRRPS